MAGNANTDDSNRTDYPTTETAKAVNRHLAHAAGEGAGVVGARGKRVYLAGEEVVGIVESRNLPSWVSFSHSNGLGRDYEAHLDVDMETWRTHQSRLNALEDATGVSGFHSGTFSDHTGGRDGEVREMYRLTEFNGDPDAVAESVPDEFDVRRSYTQDGWMVVEVDAPGVPVSFD